MKALTLRDSPDPWATLIEYGIKRIETRTRPTQYRGDLLITGSKSSKTENSAKAVCVVEVYGCQPMTRLDERDACCDLYPNAWSWKLKNLRWLSRKFSVKGQLGIFTVDMPDDVVIYQPTPEQLLSLPQWLKDLAHGNTPVGL